MATQDVRLTATNPEDSSVVPVACNEKGELKLEEIPAFDGNLQGDLTVSGDLAVSGTSRFSSNNIKFFPGGSANYAGGISLGTISGDDDTDANTRLNSDGSATFAGNVDGVSVGGPDGSVYGFTAKVKQGGYEAIRVFQADATNQPLGSAYPVGQTITINGGGSAKFAGDVVVGSRGSQWMIVESGGLAHLIQQTSFKESRADAYPQLRNIPNELTMVEQALGEVMEKLRMVPPAGWEVWDGSNENS